MKTTIQILQNTYILFSSPKYTFQVFMIHHNDINRSFRKKDVVLLILRDDRGTKSDFEIYQPDEFDFFHEYVSVDLVIPF